MSESGSEFPRGARYEVNTVPDIIALYRRLPEDRAELMLKEVTQGIRYAAVSANLMAALGAEVIGTEPAVWIDDDGGNLDVNYRTEGGEEVLNFHVAAANPANPQ